MDRYVSAAECHLEVNGVWAESVESIEWSENLRKRPLYGALSKEIKGMTDGSLEISGNIVVFHDQTGQFESMLASPRDPLSRSVEGKTGGKKPVIAQIIKELQEIGDGQSLVGLLTEYSNSPAQLKYITELMNGALDPAEELTMRTSFYNGAIGVDNMKTPIRSISIVYPDKKSETLTNVWIIGRSKRVRNGVQIGAQPLMHAYSFIAQRIDR